MSGAASHGDLVKIAEKWLLRERKCSFVFTELECLEPEIPDAIGFHGGYSTLIECKLTRADFLSDAKKPFRRRACTGMGTFRFYLCPAGVIQPADLPEKWGLIWVNEKRKSRQIVGPEGNIWSNHLAFMHERNIQAEWCLMASALRRLHIHGVLPLIYEKPKRPLPHDRL